MNMNIDCPRKHVKPAAINDSLSARFTSGVIESFYLARFYSNRTGSFYAIDYHDAILEEKVH
jgi:hypothetical protein